jgi:hypothetical protein
MMSHDERLSHKLSLMWPLTAVTRQLLLESGSRFEGIEAHHQLLRVISGAL